MGSSWICNDLHGCCQAAFAKQVEHRVEQPERPSTSLCNWRCCATSSACPSRALAHQLGHIRRMHCLLALGHSLHLVLQGPAVHMSPAHANACRWSDTGESLAREEGTPACSGLWLVRATDILCDSLLLREIACSRCLAQLGVVKIVQLILGNVEHILDS